MISNNNYNIDDLKTWDDKICNIAKKFGLDWYPINYEICNYYEMIGHMSYHGMPSHYNHWSYGKSFERTHFMYNQGQSGLPYELIINSESNLKVSTPLPGFSNLIITNTSSSTSTS